MTVNITIKIPIIKVSYTYIALILNLYNFDYYDLSY